MTKKIKRYLAAAAVTLTAAFGPMAASAADNEPPQRVPHFAWGAEVGGGIDMTSNDMSTVNFDAFVGYRNSWISLLGVGAQIDMMVNESYRAFPVYAVFRSNFRKRPSVVFFDLRLGCVFNNLASGVNQTRFYTSPGIGFNLAGGRTFQSYLIVGYSYNDMSPFVDGTRRIDIHGLHSANVRLGITF